MTREQFINRLEEKDIQFDKVRFIDKTRDRYKPQQMSWEAWVYQRGSSRGFLITQNDWENEQYREDMLLTLKGL